MKFPHPWNIKNRYLRRIMICVTFPYAVGLAAYGAFVGAKLLWRADFVPTEAPTPPAN